MWYKISRMAKVKPSTRFVLKSWCLFAYVYVWVSLSILQKQIACENKMLSLFQFIHNSIRSNYQEQTNVTWIRIDKKWIILYLLWSELNNEHIKCENTSWNGIFDKQRVVWWFVLCERCYVMCMQYCKQWVSGITEWIQYNSIKLLGISHFVVRAIYFDETGKQSCRTISIDKSKMLLLHFQPHPPPPPPI